MNDLELAIHLSKKIAGPVSSGRVLSGRLPQAEYASIHSDLEKSGLEAQYDQRIEQLSFKLPSQDDLIFASCLEDLISAPSRQARVPKEFYLSDIDYHYKGGENAPDRIVQYYLDTARFIQEIAKVADHSVLKGKLKAIFLHGQKIELSLGYTVNDLRPLDGCQDFYAEFVNAQIHKEQKSSIIKSVLIEMLKTNELDRLTLPCLLKRFSEFVERVNANYQLYVSEFSFEKIRDQVEKEKLDFMLKLNKVFSEIQNQLLAIPVALILIGSQTAPTESISLHNIFIFFSMLVFAALMSLLLRNQRHFLDSIRIEMMNQWDEIKQKHVLTTEKLQIHYEDLEKRYGRQKLFLGIVSGIIALAVFASAANFVYSTAELRDNYEIAIVYGICAGALFLVINCIYKLWMKARRNKSGSPTTRRRAG